MMKRKNDSDLQCVNKPSKTKRATVAINNINSNQAFISTAEASVITPTIAPSFHRTLMTLCRENLQIDGSATPLRLHEVSALGLCHPTFPTMSLPAIHENSGMGMNDECLARSSSYLSNQPTISFPEVAGNQVLHGNSMRMPLICQQPQEHHDGSPVTVATKMMNINAFNIGHFDQIASNVDHLHGCCSPPFRTTTSSFPMTSLNEIFDMNQNRIMNRIANSHMPLEYSTLPRSCATSPGTITDWLGMSPLTSSIHADDYDSSRTTTTNVLVTATQMTDRVPAELRGVQPPCTTNILSMLPSCITTPIDFYKLSPHQCLLREQIEYFEATEVDAMVPIRGRNKQITTGQVGIRCKNCAHVPMSRRQKGSTYFPSNKLGIYQAAQNMSTTHLQCGLCIYTPASIKNQFATIMMDRQRNDNGAGRPYWAKSATQSGFIDTEEHGIRFIRSALPLGACVTEKDLKILEA